jgi:hypothetical protein
VLARIERDRKARLRLRAVTRTIPVEWFEDTSLPIRFIDHPHRLRADAWHRHADFTFNHHRVHVDLFGGNGSGPGFGFREERIYLDGELNGRAWSLGVSLGGGGTTEPAIALLRKDLALRVVWKEQVVQLVARKEPGVTKRLRKLRD